MNIKKIYLAGSVPKSDKEISEIKDWRDEFVDVLSGIDKDFVFINPRENRADEDDPRGVFGLDCLLIKESDLIIINILDRAGVGTAQEILIAKYFNKPVITVLPKETHHRRKDLVFGGNVIEDWVHPFLFETSDIVVELKDDLKDALVKLESLEIKNITCIDSAVEYYQKKYKKYVSKKSRCKTSV